jgi:hypothetical protein
VHTLVYISELAALLMVTEQHQVKKKHTPENSRDTTRDLPITVDGKDTMPVGVKYQDPG